MPQNTRPDAQGAGQTEAPAYWRRYYLGWTDTDRDDPVLIPFRPWPRVRLVWEEVCQAVFTIPADGGNPNAEVREYLHRYPCWTRDDAAQLVRQAHLVRFEVLDGTADPGQPASRDADDDTPTPSPEQAPLPDVPARHPQTWHLVRVAWRTEREAVIHVPAELVDNHPYFFQYLLDTDLCAQLDGATTQGPYTSSIEILAQ